MEAKTSSEPKNSRFTQQELPACRPVLTPGRVALILFAIGATFIPVGVVCLVASNSVVEVSQRYDDLAICEDGFFPSVDEKDNKMSTHGLGTNCTISLTVPKEMKAPVYVYYKLENYYQNHRRYVKSRSDSQLSDKGTSDNNCEPQLYTSGNPSEEINPCGLIAWSYFNDSYTFMHGFKELSVNEKGIAWESDVKHKFEAYAPKNFNTNPATRGGGTIKGMVKDDEHFVVWMRTAALPSFRKLWGKIETDLEEGSTISIRIANRYNTYKFSGTKSIVLSTTSWLGGKNDFLGIAYLVIGSLCIAFSIVFMYFTFNAPRKLGDIGDLSWEKS